MENKEKELNFQMKISSVEVLKFIQNEFIDPDQNSLNSIDFQTDYSMKILEETNEIAVECNLIFKAQEEDIIFGELKMIIKFMINPFDEVVKKLDNNIDIPDVLLYNLFNIATGTARGILFEKLRGTIFQNHYLPLIDVKALLKNQE